MRAAGAGLWLPPGPLLRATAEHLAKAQFAAKRRPDDCALLYCALGKKAVLQVSQPPPPVSRLRAAVVA